MDLATSTSRERHFSVLGSTKREEQAWDNEGGHMSSMAGGIARTHEGEALIQRNASPSRRTLHIVCDRRAGDEPLREASP